MKRVFTRRTLIGVCIVLLLLFVVRPRAGRLRGRVSQSIAQAVGRNVEISSLHLRFFPRPGFTLDDLVIRDNSTSEPVLRSPDVTAWLRVGALLHGRIEISRLNLSDASVNLSRDDQGRWNIEDLIERTSHTALAPTGAARQKSGPSFPYIEASRARINFKEGAEKTHFALTNAEFALWQDSRDTWGVRLKAAPIRTDANLTDTGLMSLNGEWHRAANAHETPVELSFEWKQGQIGQLSKLIYGTEKQWRGGVAVSGTATGTPEKLKVSVVGSLDDFKRRDVLSSGDLKMKTRCDVELNLPAREMANLDCLAPSGTGVLEIKGSASGEMSGYLPFSKYDLLVTAQKTPAQGWLGLMKQTNSNFPEDLTAAGEVSGNVEISKTGAEQTAQFKGEGSFKQLQISSTERGNEIAMGTVPFSVLSEEEGKRTAVPVSAAHKKLGIADRELERQPHIVIGPVSFGLGRSGTMQARAVLRQEGFEGTVKGPAGIKRLLEAAQVLRIPAPVVSADGGSNVDLVIEGGWSRPPVVTGSAQLHTVRAEVRGLNSPLEIANANIIISREAVNVTNLTASAAGATVHGTLQIPRPCASASACEFAFNLRTPELSATALNAVVNPAAGRSWYKVISLGTGQQPYLLQARASGKIGIDKLALGKTECSHFSADVKLNAGTVTLANLQGEVLQGHVSGQWVADFTKKPPEYRGNGTLDDVDLAQIADLMHDGWVKGSGNAQYEFNTKGWTIRDLIESADLQSEFAVSDGAFPRIALGSAPPEPIKEAAFAGKLHLQDGKFSLDDAKLESAARVYKVSGSASLAGDLDLRITNETSAAYNVTGTLAKTKVVSVPTAEAELKP